MAQTNTPPEDEESAGKTPPLPILPGQVPADKSSYTIDPVTGEQTYATPNPTKQTMLHNGEITPESAAAEEAQNGAAGAQGGASAGYVPAHQPSATNGAAAWTPPTDIPSAVTEAHNLLEQYGQQPTAPTLNPVESNQRIATGYNAVMGTADTLAGTTPEESIKALANLGQYTPDQQKQILGQVQQFLQQPEGPSQADFELQKGGNQAMADALSLARSGRGGAGAQARALRGAQAQNAATMVDTARNAAQLRAVEAQQNIANQLSALNLGGNLASGIDTGTLNSQIAAGNLAGNIDAGTLQALNAAGNLQGQALNAGVTTRGQDVNAYNTNADIYRTQMGAALQPLQSYTDMLRGVISGEYGQQTAEAGKPKNLLQSAEDLFPWNW